MTSDFKTANGHLVSLDFNVEVKWRLLQHYLPTMDENAKKLTVFIFKMIFIYLKKIQFLFRIK